MEKENLNHGPRSSQGLYLPKLFWHYICPKVYKNQTVKLRKQTRLKQTHWGCSYLSLPLTAESYPEIARVPGVLQVRLQAPPAASSGRRRQRARSGRRAHMTMQRKQSSDPVRSGLCDRAAGGKKESKSIRSCLLCLASDEPACRQSPAHR